VNPLNRTFTPGMSGDVAEAVWLVVSLPPRAIVEEIVIRPA